MAVCVLIWLLVCAWQDWRNGEVSNWLTVPALLAAPFMAVSNGKTAVLRLIVCAAILGWMWWKGWFGSADVKILLFLASFSPFMLAGALLFESTAGWIIGRFQQRYPAVPLMAAGAMLVQILNFGGFS